MRNILGAVIGACVGHLVAITSDADHPGIATAIGAVAGFAVSDALDRQGF